MYDTPLKLSLSRGFIDKTPQINKLAYKEGFEPYVLTLPLCQTTCRVVL